MSPPQNPQVVTNGNVLEVYPTNGQIGSGGENLDLINLQYAFDQGGHIRLKHHALGGIHGNVTPFDIGAGAVLFLTHDAVIEGEVLVRNSSNRGVEIGTTIKRGRQLQWARSASGATVPIEVIIRDIRFEGFSGCMIRIHATKGNKNEVRGCSFADYLIGQPIDKPFYGAFPIVAENESDPSLVGGRLAITNCHFGEPSPAGVPVDGMNNLVHVSNCKVDLEISDNQIDDMYWAGFVVYGNMGHTKIRRNVIVKSSDFAAEGAAITFGIRPYLYPQAYDGTAEIEENTIVVRSKNCHGIVVAQLADSQYEIPVPPIPPSTDRVTVRKNVVKMEPPNAAINTMSALACLGAASRTSWKDNVVQGSAGYGIYVSRTAPVIMIPVPDTEFPTANTFEKNHLAGGQMPNPVSNQNELFAPFEATRAQMLIEEGPTDVPQTTAFDVVTNSFGHVTGSNAAPPAEPEHAVIRCRGRYGRLSRNDFSWSNMQGWPAANHAGCVYLGPTSSNNAVEYQASQDFPPGTTAQEQIRDDGQSNQINAWPPAQPVVAGQPPAPPRPTPPTRP